MKDGGRRRLVLTLTCWMVLLMERALATGLLLRRLLILIWAALTLERM